LYASPIDEELLFTRLRNQSDLDDIARTESVAKLIYSTIASLDCFVEDSDGAFDWATPDDDVFAFINDRERPIGTYLYGRRMYETMVYWETHGTEVSDSTVEHAFTAIWRAANKIVYSTTLAAPSSPRTIIEREFNENAIRRLKETSSHDITIGGAELASHALRAGLVDEVQLYLVPIVVGAGKRAFPLHQKVRFELREERRFLSGQLFLRYAVVL
jgi:dihydrofolate reductase